MTVANDLFSSPLPKGWRLQTIGQICDDNGGEVQTGPFGSQLHAADYVDDGVPSVMPKDIIESQISTEHVARINEADANRLAVHRMEPGDVLYARRGDIGRRALVTEKERGFICGTGCLRIRLNAKDVSPAYLMKYLGHPVVRRYVEDKAQGATMLNLNTSILRSVPVRIPSIAQQIRITDILDRADAIRRKRKQAIALTEQLLRSTFLEMFGDPVTNPKAWPMATVGELTSAIKDGPHVSPRYAATGVPFISTRNIRPGKLLLNDVKYLTEADYADVTKQFRPQAGDVLLTKGGTTGFAKVVDWDWPFAVWVHLAVLRPQPNVLPEYLEAALNSPNCYAQAQHYTRGIANRDLGLSRIAKIRMAIPPIELQRTYRSCQQQLNAVIAKQEVGLQDVEALVAALVSAAFTHGTV